MPRAILALLAAFLLWAGPVHAMTFENCAPPEMKVIEQAVKGAAKLAGRAAANVTDSPEYSRWFGPFDRQGADTVRATLKAVDGALRRANVKVICPGSTQDCKDTFAFVQPDMPYAIHLCPEFFGMPSIHGIDPMGPLFQNGTREGTIIHEMTHFHRIAGTGDHCYRRSACSEMARTDARAARENADSYQYFAEDVMLLRRVGRP
jgi:peptidyl-Lys metalloendopeptidase